MAFSVCLSLLQEMKTWSCTPNKSHRKRRFVAVFVIIVLALCYIYYKLNLLNYGWYTRSHRSSLHCRTPPDEMDDLILLSRDLHFSLEELSITHWLVYGSLWGAIRYNAPLPWDNDVDLGVLLEDINQVSEKELIDKLASKKITVKYHYWGGFYRVTRGSARADLMIFHNYKNGFMERIGVESYVFFINYKKMHAFPSSLVMKPLPTAKFAGVNMPVPQKGIEIQKYHYPYDWWKESKPVGCEKYRYVV